MDLKFTAEEEAFRTEVLDFLRERLPQRIADKVHNGRRLTRDDMAAWHATLNEKGWLANHWPREYGGPGWSAVQKFIFENECAIAGAPRIVPFGVNMLGPVLIKYGSEAQKRYWLPRILDGSDWWCQGYSEPGAGSDLASVRTTAVRDDDHYVVNGQKTWTTLGHYANMIFCLVRTATDVRKQEGISFLLIDMSTPGIEVRPIITLDGEHEVNEVFFTDVRVPVANLVGEENKG
ncbi:MAG: pimeloyl-CoA dehydrogenase large subunit, partial [Paraburkholderia sp.]